MVGPDQPLDIDLPPTQLLAVDHFVARLTLDHLGSLMGLPFALTLNRRFTPG
jgi:hypothetical protein